jgi:ATP-dependent RNA helicase DeaD
VSFTQFNFSKPIQEAVDAMGFEKPSDIQEQAIPILLDYEGDFVGQAQTGTGKTAAFLLPLLEKMDTSSRDVEALVIAPTRELAGQVQQELQKLSRFMGVRSTTVYGGTSYSIQERALKKDRAQIVVGTPGRIIDLIKKGTLKLNNCKNLILDEADEMLNMGFLEDVQSIITSLPEEKRIWMFSATMPGPIANLVKREFTDPQFVKVKKQNLTNDNILQQYCVLNRRDFTKGLRIVLASQSDCFGIVFCETRMECKTVADGLIDLGISAGALHGEMGQAQREATMKRFKAKKLSVLVCTDIAARGIDVSHITHVFNLGLPRQLESYVHRIGRTGRAGEKGVAISFIQRNERGQLKRIEAMTNQKLIPFDMPKASDLKKLKIEGELTKMNSLRDAVTNTEEDFILDASYEEFENYFSELDKDQTLKLLFSYRFNRELRMLEEGLKLSEVKSGGGGGSRAGRVRRTSGARDDSRRGRSNRSASGRRSGERRSNRSEAEARSERRSSRKSSDAPRSRRTRRSGGESRA